MAKSNVFFLAAVASLPLQLSKFIFPDSAYVLGIPIDYRALSIYFADFLIILYLLFFALENKKKSSKIAKDKTFFLMSLFLLNFYFSITSVGSRFSPSTLWFNVKLLEFSLFSLFAAITLSNKKIYDLSLKVISFSLIWESLLVVLEFIKQSSLGLSFLGERNFDAATTSIAHSQFLGRQFLRPYGTFPHPNVLAAFLVLGLIILTTRKMEEPFFTKKLPSIIFSFPALVVTFSKSALIALVLVFLLNLKKNYQRLFVLVAIIIIGLILLRTIGDFQISSIAERLVLAQAALIIAGKNLFFGVGSNNFIVELAKLNLFSVSEVRLLQPVHNIFLLILAENGIFGLAIFSFFLFTVLKKADTTVKITIFLVLLLFASVDHFLWTLNQGRMLFFLSIGYILSKKG